MLSKLKSERTRFVILFQDVFSQNSLLTTLKVGLLYVFKMDFHELEGERRGSKVLATEDHHMYRYSKPNTAYLMCYLGLITKIMQKTSPDVIKCHATGIVKDGKIILHKNHNHDPDDKIYDRLSA